MRRFYIRCESDCVCIRRPDYETDRFGICDGLNYEAFKEYVYKGICGTYDCPFYKKSGTAVRIGRTEHELSR